MDAKRLQRYRQKINFISEKIGSLLKKPETSTEIDATLYRIQTAIDATTDIIAMLVKDKGLEVGDDYSNIHLLEKQKILSKSLANALRRLNGLRNAVVHKYNSFEEKTVIEGLEEIVETLEEFLEKIENELENRTK